MTLLYSPDGKRRIDYHPDHVERLGKFGWTVDKPKESKPKKEKTSVDDVNKT